MDFGVTSKLWEYGIGSRTSAMKEKNADGGFAEIAAAKAAEKEASLRSVNEMRTTGANHYMGESYEERISKITDKTAASAFQTAYVKKMVGATDYISTISKAYSTGKVGATNFENAFPQYDVITHVGNANISSGNWQRNDFPFWKFFDRNTSADALNDWKPEGANPSQMRSDLQRNYNSVGSGRITVSSSEFIEARKAREAKHAEYENLAEERTLKRKMLEQELETL